MRAAISSFGAEQQQRPADADAVAGPQPADLHDVAVDAGAVGAFQVGQDDVAVVELDLGVEAADALVVEAEEVAFLPADGDGGGQVAEDAALVDAFEHLKGHRRPCADPRDWRIGPDRTHARPVRCARLTDARGNCQQVHRLTRLLSTRQQRMSIPRARAGTAAGGGTR